MRRRARWQGPTARIAAGWSRRGTCQSLVATWLAPRSHWGDQRSALRQSRDPIARIAPRIAALGAEGEMRSFVQRPCGGPRAQPTDSVPGASVGLCPFFCLLLRLRLPPLVSPAVFPRSDKNKGALLGAFWALAPLRLQMSFRSDEVVGAEKYDRKPRSRSRRGAGRGAGSVGGLGHSALGAWAGRLEGSKRRARCRRDIDIFGIEAVRGGRRGRGAFIFPASAVAALDASLPLTDMRCDAQCATWRSPGLLCASPCFVHGASEPLV